jgi:hypothetical protein
MNCHASDSNNATGAIRKLLSGVVSISGATNSLAERRQATLDLLVEILSARFGIWSWGIGDVLTQGVQPLALLTSGYTQHQTVLFTEAALSPEADREFCRPILARMGSRITSNEIRSNLFDRESWLASGFRKHLQKLDADEWVNSVRYHSEQVFSSMFFLRSTGEPEFVQADADLVELAMESIGWLHSNFEECAPKDLLVGLRACLQKVV